jgi:hypothetical protein
MSAEKVPPLQALGRHKGMTVVVVVIAIAAGLLLAATRPTAVTAEARLAVSGENLTAQQVPGFALAAQQLAANYARYVNNTDEQSALESELGVRAGAVEAVTASPIPDSNVVRIEVTARDAVTARNAAAAVADALLQRINAPDGTAATPEELLARFTDMSQQVATAQMDSEAASSAVQRGVAQGVDVGPLRDAAAAAASRLAVLKVQQDALGQQYRNAAASQDTASQLTVVEEAVVTGDDRLARFEQFGLAGLLAGAVLALLLASALERRRSARRGADGTDGREDVVLPAAAAPAAGESLVAAGDRRL